MSTSHRYETTVTWTGNTGTGTSGYRDYERAHEISADGKPVIQGSSDPAFRGDPARWNPEELLVASPEHAERATELHERAHQSCFIANSVNFPVHCRPCR
jgi:organic hydroperoxide reductase OsmC/OhrA